MSTEPDLTAELDAAEDIVMGRTESVETQWGSLDRATGRVFDCHTAIEEVAASHVAARKRHGFDDVLVRRTVTYGPWEEVPAAGQITTGEAAR